MQYMIKSGGQNKRGGGLEKSKKMRNEKLWIKSANSCDYVLYLNE